MSGSRNHGAKRRNRDFAHRSGFGYQQAQQFIRHFDALGDAEPDEDGLRLRIALCSDIRIGDWLFTESDERAWRTGPERRVIAVYVLDNDTNAPDSTVELETIDGDTQTLIAHAQTMVYRPSSTALAESIHGVVVVDPPANLNEHLALRPGDGRSAVAAVFRRLGIGTTSKPTVDANGSHRTGESLNH